MTHNEIQTLEKLGIHVTDIEYRQPEINPYDGNYGNIKEAGVTIGSFEINEHVFGPTIRLVKLVEMISESKNPQIEEQFNHLVTMLFLTEDKKNE